MIEQERTKTTCAKKIGFILVFSTIFFFAFSSELMSQHEIKRVIDLNGDCDFEQTIKAFPPGKFTRNCPVPGFDTAEGRGKNF